MTQYQDHSEQPVQDRPSKSLKDHSLQSFLWLAGGTGLSAILKLIVLAVLSRLLTPEDFGLVGAALTVIALSEVFAKIGVAPSIVQSRALTPEMTRTGNTVTLVAGVIVAIAVYLLAETVARLYAMATLDQYVRVFALLFIIRGIGLVSEALILRRMQFRFLAGIEVFTYLFGYALVAVILAILGYGAWALVIGQLTQTSMQTLFYIRASRIEGWFGFNVTRFLAMIRFGTGVTLGQIGNYVAQNADYFIVGRFLGATSLGFYTRAYLLLAQPAELVGKTADKVMFSAMSSVQDSAQRLGRAFNLALKLCAVIQIPMTVLLIVAAPEVVAVLLGAQWDEIVLPFQILVLALFFRTAYKFVGTLLRATGKVYFSAAWQWSYAAFVVIGAVSGLSWGLVGVSVGVSAAVISCFAAGMVMVRSLLGLSLSDGLWALARYSALGLLQALSLWALKSALVSLGSPDTVTLVTLSLVIGIGNFALLTIFPSFFREEGALIIKYTSKALDGVRKNLSKAKPKN